MHTLGHYPKNPHTFTTNDHPACASCISLTHFFFLCVQKHPPTTGGNIFPLAAVHIQPEMIGWHMLQSFTIGPLSAACSTLYPALEQKVEQQCRRRRGRRGEELQGLCLYMAPYSQLYVLIGCIFIGDYVRVWGNYSKTPWCVYLLKRITL